jgi:hypothetical protein
MATDIVLKSDHVEIVGNVRSVRNEDGSARIEFNVTQANITLGGDGKDGDLMLLDEAGQTAIHLTGGGGSRVSGARIVLDGQHGLVHVRGLVVNDGEQVLSISGQGVQCRRQINVGGRRGATAISGDEISIMAQGRITKLRAAIEDLQQRVARLEGSP